MIQIKVILIASTILLLSCNQSSKEPKYGSKNIGEISTNSLQQNNGYILMKNYCYVCHNPNAISHDSIVAPPFKAIKMRYTRKYGNKEDFVNSIVNWAQNPDENKALMYGAVKRFKVMPKLPLGTKELEAIASFMYDNEVEEPAWMEKHMKEMQGKGMNNTNN